MKHKKWRRCLVCVFILIILVIASILILRIEHKKFLKKIYPLGYSSIVSKEASANSIDPALVYSVIKTESNFNQNAKSKAGAVGLMQLTPDTFKWLQTKLKPEKEYTENDLYEPSINIKYGCKFLSILIQKYNNRRTALCAYNAGMGTVNSWLKDTSISSDGKSLTNIPYKETRNYALSVENNYKQYKELYDFD